MTGAIIGHGRTLQQTQTRLNGAACNIGPHTAVLTGMRYSIKCFVLIVSLMAPALVAADQSPDWTLESADGDAVTLSIEAQNQPVIVLFWATWCPYCKALMPYLDEIRAEYGDRVKILAVNFREKGDPVAYIRSKGYDFTILPKGDRVAMAYEIWGTPGVLIVNDGLKISFDLRDVPPPASLQKEKTQEGKKMKHAERAALLASYWADEIRKNIDLQLSATIS